MEKYHTVKIVQNPIEKYHTVEIVQNPIEKSEEETKTIPLAHKYMTAHLNLSIQKLD